MSERINQDRRHFLSSAAMTVAAAELASIGSVEAQPSRGGLSELPAFKPGTNRSFGSLKEIDAGVLNVCYAEVGPADGPAVLLLHGWPYDIQT